MPADAIDFLISQHKEIRALFQKFQKNAETATPQQMQQMVDQINEALTVHTYLENECMYPITRQMCPGLESAVLESYQEHHVADVLAAELAEMSPDDERYAAKATVLMETMLHHIEEEETEWFPKVREGMDRKQLQEMGEQMAKMQQNAPRRPSDSLKKAVSAMV
ncbi:Hemerythrin HHE cation binding domain-containing protein [Micromonospora pattaloongensis]|uniref:Hemerythrin HHE cation binding domain-containing protein n=1 Tax=Micromonospora pattaloongensis TaxID=405436 RepID=A0A1H3RUZ5_9ACTN|nr:hemerythrin domain-containing protein [Micromonospora pattaloongensis]SDZ29081.1 Hemerythrin HHE cation binding domain-containing protein [Micromonospora pattaloongensis]